MPLIPIALALATYIPDIIRWITGSKDAEAVAGKVVDIARSVTGVTDANDALSEIRADPEKVLAFQLAVMANRIELEKLYYENIQKDRDDVANARARDIEYVKAQRYNWRADAMVAMTATGLMGCLLILIFFQGQIPGEVVGIVSTVAGIFGSCLKDAFTFEFGSSRSSRDKDGTIADIAKMP